MLIESLPLIILFLKMNCYSSKAFILHDNFPSINMFVNELGKYNENTLVVKVSSNSVSKEFDKEIYESDFVIFIISKENYFPNELILANTLGKECFYIFLDDKVSEMVEKTLDAFKMLFQQSFKHELFDKSQDFYLFNKMLVSLDEKIYNINKELMFMSSSSSSESSEDFYKRDEMPFRHGHYQTRCTHGVRCYCGNIRTHFWR